VKARRSQFRHLPHIYSKSALIVRETLVFLSSVKTLYLGESKIMKCCWYIIDCFSLDSTDFKSDFKFSLHTFVVDFAIYAYYTVSYFTLNICPIVYTVLRAVLGKKRCWGWVERNVKMGVPPSWDQHIFVFFYGTVHMDIPGNIPTHRILIGFSSTPDAFFPKTALSHGRFNINILCWYWFV